MRHANDNILYTVVDAAVNQSLHAGNQGFTSFQSKALVVGIFRSEKSLKARAPYEAIQNSPLVVWGVLVRDWDLDSVSKPVALFSIGNVSVLDSVGATVCPLTGSNNIFQFHCLASLRPEPRQDTGAQFEFLLQVSFCEAVFLQFQFFWFPVPESIRLATNA